ncbi:unnamed protein product [Parnassius mnemosyne]|uniref:Cilia- and flagella-associated protein 61 N-terminal domain-containing protein n=1 Tax=Parnassius mnemosyne TaxID=213953 RepID=A0AAV1KKN1_9NEOP
MSIFLNVDVGPSGRRFRRAVDSDKADIEFILNRKYTDKLFGDVDIGSLIELSTLSICMIDKNKDVTGFMALGDYPNVAGVSQVDWEIWIRNMFQKYYLARNTLFIHFMCCIDAVSDFFLEDALISVFREDVYLLNIVLIVPFGCPEDCIVRYSTFKKRNVHKYLAKKSGKEEENDITEMSCNFLYTAMRQDFCPKLKVRRAVEEDNDDIIAILDEKCTRLKEMYGDYYISEIIGRHPEINRKIIVADQQDHAVGVMCLNADLNYENLQNTYELHPYYGLRKATSVEREQNKRSNVLLKTFGEPILYGTWGPFDRISKLKLKTEEDRTSHENIAVPRSTKTPSKVIFRHNSVTESSFDRVYFKKEISDDYSNKIYRTSTMSNLSVANLLDEDPFDYEIVNIDSKLLTVPRVLSTDFMYSPKLAQTARRSRMSEFRNKLKKRTSSLKSTHVDELNKVKYHGEPNAFIIELFGLRDDIEYIQAFDLLEGAFEAMKVYDYCIIRVPCFEKSFPLLQYFCFVPTKPNVCSKYALYIAHRNAVLSKLRVRKAELIDVPLIAELLNTLEAKETMWTVENSVKKKNEERIFILKSGSSIVGVGVLEPTEQLDFIQTKYNLDSYHVHKYHYRAQGIYAGFSTLKTVLIYPVFEAHFRFFVREMMRLSECYNLVWLTAYRNKWVTHKINSVATAMIPLLPRKSEDDCTSESEPKRRCVFSNTLEAFSTWFISKKFTSLPKANVDTRIVIVGASRTAMAFLNALLFGDSCTYLSFTNVTLISPNGLPYVRHTNGLIEKMFLKCRSNTNKYLKSVPYTYYVNIVQGTMTEINRQGKFVTLANGGKVPYDLLFLLFGKQYQHPYYMKIIQNRDDEMKSKKVPLYTPLDVPKCNIKKFTGRYTPDNVFIINNLADAKKALKYVKNNLLCFDTYCVLVYGSTIHAYCCLSTLLEMGVLRENIVFIEPFPSEEKGETRVSLFANSYVDRTVMNILEDSKIKVYRSFYFKSWSCDFDDQVTSVNFLSHFKMVQLPCSAFFYYGTQGVDEAAFVAINKCGIAYNEGILIDHQFKTKDSAIYAAGPATRYNSNCYAEDKQQVYYDSYEVGTKLGEQIKKQLDPLLVSKIEKIKKDVTINNDLSISSATPVSKKIGNIHEYSTKSTSDFKDNDKKMPDFKRPKIMHCVLPGGLQYLEVRSPGKKSPCHYVQSLNYNGHVIETFKEGYFKLHLNKDLIVDGITCLTPDKRSLKNFSNLYGQSAVVLNNVHLRYTTKKLDNLYSFFRLPWAYFLYHDQCDELFAMVKELLPKGQRSGDTLKEALYSIGERVSVASSTQNTKAKVRSAFETSSYVEAIADYVIEWLSENENLLPVYLQPWHQSAYACDLDANPAFKKRKRSIIKMINAIY